MSDQKETDPQIVEATKPQDVKVYFSYKKLWKIPQNEYVLEGRDILG